MTDVNERKRAAAQAAIDWIEDGMVLGLGTGSTAALAVELLAERVRAGLKVSGIPTSERTAQQARQLGVPLVGFAEHSSIDIAFDGADEVEAGTLHLIKGLGGALLREKLVASAAKRFIVMVDDSKIVEQLGSKAPVPVEIVPFGWELTIERLRALGCAATLRSGDQAPFVSDGGHYIADCRFGPIEDPSALERRILDIVGVVDTGLFLGMTREVLVAGAEGVSLLSR